MKNKYKVLITLAGLTAAAIHGINRLAFSFTTKKNLLSKTDISYYEWRFGKIAYTVRGTGSPLLLVHDLIPGSSQFEYHRIIDALSKKHTVYAIDLIGYGNSDKANLTYTNFLFTQLISDFIKTVIGKKTDVIASGDSSSVILMCSHNEPELINRMAFINPQSLYQSNQIPSKQTRTLKFFIEMPLIGTMLFNILTSDYVIKNNFEKDYFFDRSLIDNEIIWSYVEAAHLGDYNAKYSVASYVGKYTNTNVIHALKETNNSIMLIGGKEVPSINTNMDNYQYYNPSVEIGYIEHAKTLPQLERPEQLLETLSIYLDN